MRSAIPADAERLAPFNAAIHSDDGPGQPEEWLAAWTRDLMTRPHPTFHAGLTTIIEDPESGKIISTALLIPQTWTYDGIPFGVGRPELIATDPDYRGRGFVRQQMNLLHQWSAEMGHKMQVITGIPYFYRQFGYEMGLDLGGGRIAYEANIPQLAPDEAEQFTFRRATVEDVPFLIQMQEQAAFDGRFACIRDTEHWIYELNGKSADNDNQAEIRVIVKQEKEDVGFIIHPISLAGKLMSVNMLGLTAATSWQEITPALLRYLQKTGKAFGKAENKSFEGVFMRLGKTHPIFDLFPNYFPASRNPYAWYIRIPDLPDFISLITPVLEKRLATSPMHGYTGEIHISFFRSGLKLTFKAGNLTTSEAWMPTVEKEGDARFPDLSFLSLVCGRRSFNELSGFFADCYAYKDEVTALLSVLFPPQTSNVWGVE